MATSSSVFIAAAGLLEFGRGYSVASCLAIAEADAPEVPKHSFGTDFASESVRGEMIQITLETAMTHESAEIHFHC